jgi:hypothetical protein
MKLIRSFSLLADTPIDDNSEPAFSLHDWTINIKVSFFTVIAYTKIKLSTLCNTSPTIAQAVIRQPLTMETRAHSQVSPGGFSGGRGLRLSVSFYQYSIFIRLSPTLCNYSN